MIFAVGMLASGIAPCAPKLLPLFPPRDLMVELVITGFPNGMTPPPAVHAGFTPEHLHYRNTGTAETVDVHLPIEPEIFEAFYATLLDHDPGDLRVTVRSRRDQEREVRLRVRANGNEKYLESRLIPIHADPDRERFLLLATSIRHLADKLINARRRPVKFCLDTKTLKRAMEFVVGHWRATPWQDASGCHEFALLDGAHYTIKVLYPVKNRDRNEIATGVFALAPGVNTVQMALSDEVLRFTTASD